MFAQASLLQLFLYFSFSVYRDSHSWGPYWYSSLYSRLFPFFGLAVIPPHLYQFISSHSKHSLPSPAHQARYVQAKLSVHDRSLKVATVIESLEMEMELLCLTGVEDQLQTDVRPTLEILRNAGIKVWGGGQTHSSQ